MSSQTMIQLDAKTDYRLTDRHGESFDVPRGTTMLLGFVKLYACGVHVARPVVVFGDGTSKFLAVTAADIDYRWPTGDVIVIQGAEFFVVSDVVKREEFATMLKGIRFLEKFQTKAIEDQVM